MRRVAWSAWPGCVPPATRTPSAIFGAAYDGLRAHRGPTAPETDTVRRRLVELYERWNRPDQAQHYRNEAGQ